jgi:hypothetical protein
MAQSAPQPRSTPPATRLRLRPPLWAQWVISLTVAVVAIVLLIRFVDANSTPRAQAPHLTAKGNKTLNAEAEILDSEQQAPHVVRFAPSVAPVAAIQHAIAAYMNQQIDFALIAGPLRQTLCFAVPGARTPDLAYRCSALARGTSYPFEGVVDRATRTVTYCRHNPPPNPGDNVPVSRRCVA